MSKNGFLSYKNGTFFGILTHKFCTFLQWKRSRPPNYQCPPLFLIWLERCSRPWPCRRPNCRRRPQLEWLPLPVCLSGLNCSKWPRRIQVGRRLMRPRNLSRHYDLKHGKKYNHTMTWNVEKSIISVQKSCLFFQSKNCIFHSFKHFFGAKMDFFQFLK